MANSVVHVAATSAASVSCFKPTFTFTLQMPAVTVKDVNQQDFVKALSAFLKKYVV